MCTHRHRLLLREGGRQELLADQPQKARRIGDRSSIPVFARNRSPRRADSHGPQADLTVRLINPHTSTTPCQLDFREWEEGVRINRSEHRVFVGSPESLCQQRKPVTGLLRVIEENVLMDFGRKSTRTLR